ncbi:MAG TPA: FlgD immunoglobulin-like domain containing protein [Candidatus Kapabacteria bacterium]|nr:FlgD immunoglobulin-like domain containing protein [Candidatus Kapabacteria bacterium]
MIERPWSFTLLLTACLFPASRTIAQPAGIVARMLFPPRNYEIALGDSITPSVRVWNRDSVASTPLELHYRIRNVTTYLTVYEDSLLAPAVAPGDSIDEAFSAFATSPNILKELGSFHACLTLANDTSHAFCTRLFGVRRTAVPYRDPSNNYSHTSFGDIPDQTRWVSEGATVLDGEDSTWDPPPPRANDGFGPDTLISPVLRLDRKDVNGNFYSGDDVGDTLTSFPINMQGMDRMTLWFDYMRAGRYRYPLRWDDSLMLGPESTILDSAGNVIRPGDSLILEFKKPSAPAENPAPEDWNEMAAIDGGRDFEFKSFFARQNDSGWQVTIDGITKAVADTSNYLTTDFRFRFRLKANDNAPQTGSHADDADEWYIDNPTVTAPLKPELEVRWVRVVNPYSKVPQSQAVFPIFVDVIDVGTSYGVGLPFRVTILDPNGNVVYSQQAVLDRLTEGQDTVLRFPNWDASNLPGNATEYTVTAALGEPGVNAYQADDSTYTKFYLNVDDNPGGVQDFAYDDAGLDPGPNTGNDIPKLTGIPGSGIGFPGTTGSLAMKFQLARKDTLYGTRLYFGSANQAPDYIRLSLHNGDSNSCVPLDTVVQPGVQTTMEAERGGNEFNQFWTYIFPKPIILPKGIYWMAVSQLNSFVSMDLGGYFSRGGGQFVTTSVSAPRIQSTYGPSSSMMSYGTQWGSSPADNNGNVGCSFAMETPAGSGNWKPLTPDTGWWPAMTASSGMSPIIIAKIDSLPWTGTGTYLPMIRPMVGLWTDITFGVSASPLAPAFGFQPNYPNPFDPNEASTTISFTLPAQAPVSLTICNIMGNVVKTLVNAAMPAGMHSVSWDGRDEHGAIVPAGIYFVTLKSDESHVTAKLIVTE